MRFYLGQVTARLRASRFTRDVMVVGGGIALAQVITLVFAPFLTRLYGPGPFGAAAAFAAVVNILMPLASLGYADAIVQPVEDEDAGAVARLSILCSFVLAPLSLAFVYLGKSWLVDWTGLESAPWALYLIPPSILVSAFLAVANQAAIREGLFKSKARAYVESTLWTNIAKLGGGFLAPTGLVMIVTTLGGRALNVILQLARVQRNGVLSAANWFGTSGVRNAAVSYRDFALFRMPQNIINATSFGLPVILLASLFGNAAAGQYSITLMVMSAPVVLLGQSVGEVFYPKITRAIQRDPRDAFRLLLRATSMLFAVGFVPFATVALFGDKIFPLVFGSQWLRAGQYSQWAALWMAFVLVTRPAVASVAALRMQGTLLAYEILITGARVFALYAGSRFGNDLTAIKVFSLVNVFGYACLFAIVAWKLRRFNQ